MPPVRVAFDPALPVITTGPLDCGARKFAGGDALPWRDLGLSEFDLLCFYRSGLVAFVARPVAVETPKQKRQRAPQRAE